MRLLKKIVHAQKGFTDILDTVLRIILAVVVCTIGLALSYLGIDHYINANYPPGEYPGWPEWWSGDLLKHREESLSLLDALRYAFESVINTATAVLTAFLLVGLFEALRNALRNAHK